MISIKKGVFYTFGTKILVAILGLVMVILISKNLGAEGRGTLSLFTFYIALLQMLCDFGSSSALINLSYQYPNKNLWFTANIWVIGVCIIASIVSLFFQQIAFILFVPLCTYLLSFSNINNLLLMGNRQVVKRNFNLVLQPLLLLIFFTFFYSICQWQASAYVVSFILSVSILSVISFFLVQKYLTSSSPLKFERQVLTIGAWAQSGHLIQFLTYRVNFLVIVYFLGKASLGIYSNALLIGETLWIFGHSLGQIMHIQIINSDSVAYQRKITFKFMGINFLITSISFIIVYLLPSNFWTTIFSKEFTETKALLLPLALGIIIFSFTNIINHYFHAKNKFKWILAANSVGFITGLISALILIPQYALIGASWAWSIGLSCSMLVYFYLFLKNKG